MLKLTLCSLALPEPEIMRTLRKVCKLSARKQRQVEAFIQPITAPQPRTGN
ncbi:endoribonuclease [Pantoea piersonii]|nr:endoribonuclease [Pantoea piersonii]